MSSSWFSRSLVALLAMGAAGLLGRGAYAHLTDSIGLFSEGPAYAKEYRPVYIQTQEQQYGKDPSRSEDRRLQSLPVNAAEEIERGLGNGFRDGMVITGATTHRMILFTFDDGPDLGTTPLLLDRLDAAGVKAVFFLIANRIAGRSPRERQQAAIAREIVRRGHMVASHTFDHTQLPLLDNEAALSELSRSEAVFTRVFGGPPALIRPPGGARSPRIDRLLAERGYTTVLWNLGAGDFQVRTASDVYLTWRRVLERIERDSGGRGGIVMLHDTYPWSVDAFELIHSDLMERNCRLLERDKELFDVVDDLSAFFVPRGAAAPGSEAPAAAFNPRILAARQQRLRIETARRCHNRDTL
jgi:peptidoglycan/xylan/chitin deacetylase (PgdA/CDA1 family)